MESVSGIASAVRHSVGAGEQQVSTTHIALLRLDGRTVRLSSDRPLEIRDGDRLVLVGRQRGELFQALAHDNLTTGASGDQGWVASIVIGALIFCMGAMWLDLALALPNNPASGLGRLTALALAAGSLAGGVFCALRSARVRRAVRLLRRPAQKPEPDGSRL